MKKFFAIFALAALSLTTAVAQHTTTRYGVPPQDNTLAGMTGALINKNDAAGLDTIKIYPNAYVTNITVPNFLQDTIFYKITNLSGSYVGDQMNFNIIASGDTGLRPLLHLVVTSGFSVVTTDSLMLCTATTLNTKKHCNMRFIFDGQKWCEVGPTGTARIKN